eukprot:7909549-Ditylum_brightwellii.AAC.2
MHNLQLFVWRTGRAAYAFWSLVGLPTYEKGGATRDVHTLKKLDLKAMGIKSTGVHLRGLLHAPAS